MSVLISILTAGVIALFILYMTYPRFRRTRLSSARFFSHLPPPRKNRSRLRFGKLHLPPPFYLQLGILLLVLAALLLRDSTIQPRAGGGIGVWVLVDTSAGMGTAQGDETRMDAARREVTATLEHARRGAKETGVCFRLSAVDLERRDLVTGGDADAVERAARELRPRALGTDLGIIRRLSTQETEPTTVGGGDHDGSCPVTHLVVITDQPAPAWAVENRGIIWRDIGRPVPNTGLTALRASRDPLTGLVSEVQVEITAFGTPLPGTALTVTRTVPGAVGEETVREQALSPVPNRPLRTAFVPAGPGRYRIRLTPGGAPADAYPLDDTAVIEIDGGLKVHVDWQLPDRRLPREMGWVQDPVSPHLRVTAAFTAMPGGVPTLTVGAGYNAVRGKAPVIRDFMEDSPLLADINLDAVENLRPRGITRLPADLQPVLRGMDGRTWLAQGENPLRAFVPGLPTGGDDLTGRFSAAVFYNALRWLLQKRELPPLYRLTSPYDPEPGVGRLVLHKDEGNTNKVPRSHGELANLSPVTAGRPPLPLWPLLLAAAALLFLIERLWGVFF